MEVLRIAACLEEHYPHSMANAVVKAAKQQGISHDEMHSDVAYVVAHGIASCIDGEKVVIGSHHFIFEDEGCVIPENEQSLVDALHRSILICTWPSAVSWPASSVWQTRFGRRPLRF